jgi:hypothetical protein
VGIPQGALQQGHGGTITPASHLIHSRQALHSRSIELTGPTQQPLPAH